MSHPDHPVMVPTASSEHVALLFKKLRKPMTLFWAVALTYGLLGLPALRMRYEQRAESPGYAAHCLTLTGFRDIPKEVPRIFFIRGDRIFPEKRPNVSKS